MSGVVQADEKFNSWYELIKTVHHAFEYGLHCNDMTFGEIEEDIVFALDRFAKDNGLPVDWNDIELRYEPDNLPAEVEPLTDADFQALEAAKLNDYLLSSVKNARRVKEDSPDMGLRRWGGDLDGSAIGIAK